MKINEDITLLSSDGVLSLSLHIQGDTHESSIVVVSHGMSEHKERYYKFIQFLNENGFLCVAFDHRGHGNSVLDKADYGHFYDENGTMIVQDLTTIITYIKNAYPNKVINVFAHSMGTLVARNYIQNNDDKINKLILSGAPYFNKGVYLGSAMTKIQSILFGNKHKSKLLQKLTFGSFEKKSSHPIKNGWLNSDIQEVEFYNKNQKCGFVFSVNGFYCLFTLVKKCFNKKLYKVKNKNLNILFLAGEKDPVVGNNKQFEMQLNFLKEVGYSNVSHIIYPNLYHELLNEKEHLKVYQDILNFLNS